LSLSNDDEVFGTVLRLGITGKLFFGLLATSSLVALALAFAVQINFTRGFLGYLNEQELQRVERLAPLLAQAYVENGENWRFLQGRQRGNWYDMIRMVDVNVMENEEERLGPADETLMGINFRLTLVDENQERIVGAPASTIPDATLRPIMVDNRIVAYVALLPFTQVSTDAARTFERQQRISTWIISMLSILVAALVAMILARTLMSPVRKIASATRALAAGNFDQRINVSSRDELGRLADDFNLLALSLKRNEQLRRNFMADVSHELRTPLAVLKGEMEAMEDGMRELSVDNIRALQSEVTSLNKLVNDLYDLSLADIGALTYRKAEINLKVLVEQVLSQYQHRMESAGLLLLFEAKLDDYPVLADPDRLKQLFINLLENSIRYTDANGRILITLTRENGYVVVQIEDSAPGVTDEQLQQLFDRMYRVESSRSRNNGGAGLGLAICRKIAEGHDGDISAGHSSLGGIYMRVTLPVSQP
jgi:two-component system sensor histidine kinase BaeS